VGRPRQLHPRPVVAALRLPHLTDREFSLLRALIKRETGIHLNAAKRTLVAGRLAGRLRALGLPTFGAYHRYLREAGEEELAQMIDCISTNETSFFREPQQFSLLRREVLPRWRKEGAAGRRRRQLRVWCAGCSTGEEPYSVAMLLADCFLPGTGWNLAITASDISRAALDRARAGTWSVRQEAEIPELYLKRFMRKGQGRQAGKMKAGPEISALIRFEHLNLVAEEYPLQGSYDGHPPSPGLPGAGRPAAAGTRRESVRRSAAGARCDPGGICARPGRRVRTRGRRRCNQAGRAVSGVGSHNHGSTSRRATCRVLVVDDSALVRHVMSQVLSNDHRFKVSLAADPLIAMRKMEAERPDVILLDLTMPRMDGLTFLEQIMREDPIPVVVCSVLARKNSEIALRALQYGAVDVVAKPVVELETGAYSPDDAVMLTETVHAASLARVRPRQSAALNSVAPPPPIPAVEQSRQRTDLVVAIGASTGGPSALQHLLTVLPPSTPGIVIVQHMPGAFTAALANRLDLLSQFEVKEAQTGDRVRPGRALIAPGHRHMRLLGRPGCHHVELLEGPLVNHHRPSVDVLFHSVARCAGERGVGVLLTGMGEDGVAGLHEMKSAGAATIAQNEASCVVFGMPKQAIDRGIVDHVAPLGEIAHVILKTVDRGTRRE